MTKQHSRIGRDIAIICQVFCFTLLVASAVALLTGYGHHPGRALVTAPIAFATIALATLYLRRTR